MKWFTVERRPRPPLALSIAGPLISVGAALVVGAVFLRLTGSDPLTVYGRMVSTAFGSTRGVSETLVSATPLILTGAAAAVAFKMLVWNIGGEGQLYLGAIAAAGTAILLADAPAPVVLVAAVLAGAAGGAAWAALAAVPRVTLGTNEIITTLMLNFVALNLMNYLIFGSASPWRDPASTNFPQGRPLVAALPEFFRRLDVGILVAVAAALVMWWVVRSTRWGYEVRVVGDSPATARYAGIGVGRKILAVFLLSGALAGLAGAVLVAGQVGSLEPRALATGLGFTGIVVAALARLDLVAVLPVAVLMGALNNSGAALQTIRVPASTVLMLQGAILAFAVAGEYFLHHRIRRVRPTEPEPEAA